MVFDNRRTYLCYNNADLIRDGYIKTRIEKQYIPVDTFNIDRLKNPPRGVSYIVTRDPSTHEITAVKEIKKQLPASKIKIEVDFSKVMVSAVDNIISPGSLGFTPMMGLVGNFGLPAMGWGGITSGLTYMTLHILDSETKINRKVVVTEEMLDTGIWECEDGYPLSVFGIVTEHFEYPVGTTSGYSTNGLEFDENDPLKDPNIIGKYNDGLWQGSLRKTIAGATDSDGLFGGRAAPEIKFENVAYPDQPQLFDKIVKDNRTLKFRADNYDASGGKDFPPKLTGVPLIDVTDKQIRLKLTNDAGEPLFFKGQTLYITYNVASERHVRQNLSHRGDIGQGNTVGIVGFRGAIKSEVDAWDYQMRTWKVPILGPGMMMSNIDEIDNYYTSDSDYKLTLSQYLTARDAEEAEQEIDGLCDTLEGWRLSESITNGYVRKFWAADHRGILLYDDKDVTVVFPVSSIRNQEWFRDYLEGLDFTHPTGGTDSEGNDIYVTSDLQKDIENYIDVNDEPGVLFDLTDISNSLLFDREKIPYYRPFANALRNMPIYQKGDDESGVGIIFLDLLAVVETFDLVSLSDMNLGLYDLSLIEFYNSNAQPLKTYPCEELFDIHPYHYWSESYDANTDSGGMGAWYDRGHLETQIFEWRPSGASIESYWKLETPYFCGEYTKKSRVYTEKIYGNSLDNYSWIFVDTDPFVPHNISSDSHHHFDESVVVFNDGDVHNGLCYHKFVDSRFEQEEPTVEIDTSKSHVRETYNHDADFVVGQNRMLGDYPSYSHGIPIVQDATAICPTDQAEWFWFTEELYNDGSSLYGLDFNDDTPTVNIQSDWYVGYLTVDFHIEGFDDLTNVQRYVSFYFEQSESSVSQVKMLRYNPDPVTGIVRMLIDFKYYYNGPLQFLGEFWKNITIEKIEMRGTSPNHPINTTFIDLDEYRIKSGQNAVVYDGIGRLLVFYANTETGNIDVAISYDDGNEWIVHENLIRLIEGENAALPFAIKDRNADYVHLFYVLNDTFLMYKRINTEFFVYEDAFVEPVVPTSYNVDDYDQTKEKPEEDYWGYYTDRGTLLRRFPSYFVAGYYDDPYFIEQLLIKNALDEDYQTSPEADVRQTPRFEFSGNQNEMRHVFKAEPYVVYMDDEGVLRLFFTSDGKLSVKRSNNYFSWKYDIEEQIIHKNYIDDQLNRGMPEEIRNVQVVRNDFSGGLASTLYFNNGMLFVRHFQSDSLFPFYDSNGNINNENMREHLEITAETTHRPIFLVGKIPDSIREAKLREMDDGISNSDSSLFIYFPYDRDMIERFDERFEIDVDTQVYAYTTRTGLIRIFYKDSFDNLNAIVLDALKNPTLETMNKFKAN